MQQRLVCLIDVFREFVELLGLDVDFVAHGECDVLQLRRLCADDVQQPVLCGVSGGALGCGV